MFLFMNSLGVCVGFCALKAKFVHMLCNSSWTVEDPHEYDRLVVIVLVVLVRHVISEARCYQSIRDIPCCEED